MCHPIRPAVESDLTALCDLYFEFHEFHAHYLPKFLRSFGPPTGKDREDLSRKILEIIHGDTSAILVAIEKDIPIGLAEIYIKHPDPADRGVNPEPYAYLQSLAVTQTHRRKGIGTQLLRASEEWAREHGASDITLGIWEFPESPLEFYQIAGYQVYRRSLIKEL